MSNFDEVGFLSDELDQWKRAAHEAYADAFAYTYRSVIITSIHHLRGVIMPSGFAAPVVV
ncbi:hypothetical protein AB4Y38_35540 [Paraburkholderia sp. EG285A]|uniref:hypothetical protein n=1 Tax=Paraburkholderia sp. EG285A TaxID=3237009 RepID=UPI0034D32925